MALAKKTDRLSQVLSCSFYFLFLAMLSDWFTRESFSSRCHFSLQQVVASETLALAASEKNLSTVLNTHVSLWWKAISTSWKALYQWAFFSSLALKRNFGQSTNSCTAYLRAHFKCTVCKLFICRLSLFWRIYTIWKTIASEFEH